MSQTETQRADLLNRLLTAITDGECEATQANNLIQSLDVIRSAEDGWPDVSHDNCPTGPFDLAATIDELIYPARKRVTDETFRAVFDEAYSA